MKSVRNLIACIVVMVSAVHTACSVEDISALGRRQDAPPSGYVMKFERKGGYFGWRDTFWIYSDGRVVNDAGKTARVSSDLVRQWMDITAPPEITVRRKRPSMPSVGMDCYHYLITVYGQGEPRVISMSCTDTYGLKGGSDTPSIDFGQIRNTLMTLPWE